MKVKGVVDRIVDKLAVILIEENMNEITLNTDEYNVNEGDILTITLNDDVITNVDINIQEMESMKRIIDSKLNKLRKRKSKYKNT